MKKIVGPDGDCVVGLVEDENPASPTVGLVIAKKVHYFTTEERDVYVALVRAMNNAARDSHEAYFEAARAVDAYVESLLP